MLKVVFGRNSKAFLRSCFNQNVSFSNFKGTGGNAKILSNIEGYGSCLLLLVPSPVTFPVCGFLCPYSQQLEKSLQCNFHTGSIYYDQTNDKTSFFTQGTKSEEEKEAAKSLSQKRKEERQKMDLSKKFTDRNFITPLRAMNEYLLKPSDLECLRKTTRRSPFEDNPPIQVYLRRDVEQKAIEVWGSEEALQRELKKRKEDEEQYRNNIFHVKKILKEYTRSTMHKEERKRQELIIKTSGRVVLTAVVINATNFALKVLAWLHTGSHSMFAEAIHSLADTGNQLILFYGIKKSLQTPTQYHPYGYHNMRYVASLISGVGVFFLGTGLSVYHGINGILHPETMESLYWAYVVLGGSLISEGGTLVVAFRETLRGARRDELTFFQYVLRGRDPSVNVVLLEDIAAVFGIFIAAGCMSLTSYTGLPIYDAAGSLAIGGVLGAVASFIIYTNTAALVGRSIPEERLQELNKEMENDVMIRAIHDVKATDMGNNYVRYKAEIDIDGRQLTRSYLDSQDLDTLLEEMQKLKTIEEVEAFFLKHGESIVDMLGGQIDRIEMNFKKKNPEIRHVDLEVL
ncbi:proton-coupled zinc antiporter SLC30A9, mitochondrial-like [Argiope bruennichi]|uniref:Proton-coupled zinc antiporter SLC30A9, mitochondrial n=1 Tax=Argiope bruennichi TaxID=94029 RepID=A0A8T0FKE1_ARGBR|nr:proton-coupled zinc antiporter SLC30A9, mitochondrial-like [Argiope bruennichi]XP_055928990.1 proton-coupled zinc antiporter SLC30A9, mitochondrial-like [Argiope bruennichi]XP_055928991.1 proton-coupled zinc antiporter SLC30A9, mitochondrial-like [Argiope bruennichi]KAF8791416.1 Zinc transporter 9 like protein [Argiope bruennichi]